MLLYIISDENFTNEWEIENYYLSVTMMYCRMYMFIAVAKRATVKTNL